jgi:SpoVK/Ycf46/Vps4 family AAA+-type ATPase
VAYFNGYVYIALLVLLSRGGIEEYVLGLCSAQNNESIILLDNIDAISGSLGNSNSFIECSVASSVIALIDKVIHSARSRCIATSTCHLRQLHDRLHQPYRFGLSVCLELPDFRGRQVAFLAALRESCCALCVDEAIVPLDRVASVDGPSGAGSCATDIVVALSEIVARRTQGFTFGDVTNIIRDAILSTEGLLPSSLADVISCQLLHDCIASICDDTRTFEVTAGSATQVLSLSTILHTLSLLSRPVVDASIVGADGGNEAISSANITFLDAFNLPGAAAEMEGAPLVGLEDIQQRLRRVVLGPYFSDTKQYFRRLGIRPCSGVVIQSPPGCGKTALSEWLVHEGREHFKCISVSCAELVDKIVGASEQKLSNIFAAARVYAPCFLLLENIDCILGRSLPDDDGDGGQSGSGSGDLARGSMRSTRSIQRTSHHALDRILSTLLVELDGIETTRSYPATDIDNMLAHGGDSIPGKEDNVADASVVVIATTSDMSLLDGALLRPGRLEEHVHVKSPTATMVRLL